MYARFARSISFGRSSTFALCASTSRQSLTMTDDDVMAEDVAGWPLPDAYLAELGRLAAMWSTLESSLDVYLAKLAGFDDRTDPRAFILLKHSSFQQKLDAFGALCEQLRTSYAQLKLYPETISLIKRAQAGRNRYIHNSYSQNPDSGAIELAVGSARGKLKADIHKVRVVDIRRVALEIRDALRSLHTLVTGRRLDGGESA